MLFAAGLGFPLIAVVGLLSGLLSSYIQSADAGMTIVKFLHVQSLYYFLDCSSWIHKIYFFQSAGATASAPEKSFENDIEWLWHSIL